MGLTREIEQRLERAKLVAHFDANQAVWRANAQDAYDYTKKVFDGQTVRKDDIAKALLAAVEIDVTFHAALDKAKLTQKYWVGYYTDLVIERTWDSLKK
jgi:homoserine acetyltransferase